MKNLMIMKKKMIFKVFERGDQSSDIRRHTPARIHFVGSISSLSMLKLAVKTKVYPLFEVT